MKISFTKLLLLLVAVWPLTGFAKNEGKVVADSVGRNYSHWYFGAEAGLPFLFGDFTSFSHHRLISVISSEDWPVISSVRGSVLNYPSEPEKIKWGLNLMRRIIIWDRTE